MASGPITSWQIDGETVETVAEFIFFGSKITAGGDWSHEIKRCLLLWRKVMTNLDSIFKSRDITLPAKVHIVKAVVFPIVMYRCESWIIKKAECWLNWTEHSLSILCVAAAAAAKSLQSCPTLCDPMNRSTPGLPVYHQLPEFTQTHVHRVSDALQPSHPLSSPSPLAPNPSQHQSLFQWVNSSQEVAKVLEFQL